MLVLNVGWPAPPLVCHRIVPPRDLCWLVILTLCDTCWLGIPYCVTHVDWLFHTVWDMLTGYFTLCDTCWLGIPQCVLVGQYVLFLCSSLSAGSKPIVCWINCMMPFLIPWPLGQLHSVFKGWMLIVDQWNCLLSILEVSQRTVCSLI